jgi:acyl carrier protein
MLRHRARIERGRIGRRCANDLFLLELAAHSFATPADRTLTVTDVETLILDYLRTAVHADIQLDTELIDEGLLDSFAAVEMVTHLESELGLRFAPDDFTPAGFASPAALAQLVVTVQSRS